MSGGCLWWIAQLDHAILEGDVEAAAEAGRELRRLGYRLRRDWFEYTKRGEPYDGNTERALRAAIDAAGGTDSMLLARAWDARPKVDRT